MYRFANGEAQNLPTILETVWQIERFGAEALGIAPLNIRLSRRLSLAQNIYDAYKARQRYKSWADWASENGKLSTLLIWAERQTLDG